MKILSFYLHALRNDEHFEFYTEFADLVKASGAAALKIEKPFNTFTTLFADEDAALKKITKSNFTRQIHEADETRDMVFRGLTDAAHAALNHYKPDVREAATRLGIVFDTYGNVAIKSIDEETSAVQNLLGELTQNRAADMTKAGLDEWAKELLQLNNEVKRLTQERDEETAARTASILRQVRLKVDEIYRVMTARIEVLALIDTEDDDDIVIPPSELKAKPPKSPKGGVASSVYADFIGKINAVIERYNNRLAIRKGKAAKKKEGENQNQNQDSQD